MADQTGSDEALSARRGLSMGQKYIGLSVTLLLLMLAAAVYSFVQANRASDETIPGAHPRLSGNPARRGLGRGLGERHQ